MMTIKKFEHGCRRLEREGFARTHEQWSDIDENVFEVARALHPDGSYTLYKKQRTNEQ
jgi:hypothetical protein